MDLFDHAREKVLEEKAPLAARMRPRTLEEFVGQGHVLGPGRLLRRAIQADRLSSLLFYGPPGTGKTTLARIIANTTQAHFSALNAVLAGVADIRTVVAEAQARLAQHARRTILFVDEVHRFNKSQQDALLPHVENGTVVLIGATTENPYFEVNKALVSRSRIFELRPLEESDIAAILRAALADSKRGYGGHAVRIAEEALNHLAQVANGDARAALNALELAVETTPPGREGAVEITLAVAEESIQRRAVLYDKEGDAHFDVASAFIKSLRGSDPDAALYWMGRMVYAGEHPRFIFRRMLIFASEDVGLADPQALGVVSAAAQAFDYVGMPEGRYPLSQACLYLATAPKSNSTMAFFDALAVVERERSGDVPNHLKDASRDADGFGHGKGYLYPHAFRDHWVAQQYLPEGLRGRVFYQPGTVGREAQIREQVLRRREASLAAGHAGDAALTEQFPGAELTPGPITSAAGSGHLASADSTWQARGSGTLAAHLEQVRERIFEAAHVKRDSLVLVLNAGDGLLAGEALRISDAAGVWALVASEAEGEALRAQVQLGDALGEPVVRVSPGEPLPERLMGTPSSEAIRFDRILGRGVLGNAPDKAQRLERLAGLLAPGGRLVLAETVPALGERLLASLDWRGLGEGLNTRETDALAQRAQAAEAALYADPDDPQVNWTDTDLARLATAPGLRVESVQVFATPVEFTLSPRLLERWFGPGGRLAARLGDDTPRVRTLLETSLRATRGVLRRRTAVAVLAAVRE